LTLADFDQLSADFNITAGACGSGSPRFQVKVIDPTDNTAKNLFVHFGDYPNFNNCATGTWTSTGDLFQAGKYIETSQLVNGYQLLGYADTIAAYGTYEVTSIVLVVDANYAFPESGQTVLIDNVKINSTVYTFESANSCKNGGWQGFTSGPGPVCEPGQCVSYFAVAANKRQAISLEEVEKGCLAKGSLSYELAPVSAGGFRIEIAGL
jgi:hypothetical protein